MLQQLAIVLRLGALVALLAGTGLPAVASAWQSEGVEVDVELVLAVDVSLSVTREELEIQRRGYAEAITSPQVMAAIRAGLLGRVAVTYVEWAGDGAQRTLAPWTLIATEAEARAFAAHLSERTQRRLRNTSISRALSDAVEMFDQNAFSGMRRVIDISGDGPNNAGGPVRLARDAAIARGVTINGLPLMTAGESGEPWDVPDLDRYYHDCVVGGPGAFVIPVLSWDEFARAVQRKLVLEIAGRTPPRRYAAEGVSGARLWQASSPAPRSYDCLIGEKIRRGIHRHDPPRHVSD